MKIKVLYPSIGEIHVEEDAKDLKAFFSSDTEYDIENLDYGCESLETEYDTVLAIPDILRKVKKAEEDGYEGVFISCFDDPGVRAAREIVDIPVVGALETSILTAMGLADRISIVTVLPEGLPSTEMKIRQMLVQDRVVGMHVVDMPVVELGNEEKLLERLLETSQKTIKKDRAQVIVLGCTGMKNVAKGLQMNLDEQGFEVPVIDPTAAAISMLEGYIRMGLKQSRMTYPTPLKKKRRWWNEVVY